MFSVEPGVSSVATSKCSCYQLISVAGLGFESLVDQIDAVSPVTPHRCNVPLKLCTIAQVLSCPNGHCHSFHALA